MDVLKVVLLIVLLACIGTLAGCGEEYSRRSGPVTGKEIVLVPSATGFWQAVPASPSSR